MKRTKYNAKKITFDGQTFDSLHEAQYYAWLRSEMAKGTVLEFTRQPKVTLIPAIKLPDGKTQRAVTYAPDFLVKYPDGSEEFIDVKGFSTQQGDLRRKLFHFVMDAKLRWVSASKKYGDASGFCDYDDLQKKRREAKKDG